MEKSAEPVGVYLELTFSDVTLFLIIFSFSFFVFNGRKKMLIVNVEVYKLLCYIKTNVYTHTHTVSLKRVNMDSIYLNEFL